MPNLGLQLTRTANIFLESAPAFPSAGLLAFWGLNDNGNGEISMADSSGNGNTLTNNNNTPLEAAGKINGCASLSRVIGHAFSLSGFALPSGDLTISVWVKPAAYADPFYEAFVSWREEGFSYGLNPDRTFFLYQENYGIWLSGSEIANDVWKNVVLTRSGDIWTLYYDNAVDATATVAAVFTGAENLTLGGYQAAFGDRFNGLMDAVGIWNRALDFSERDAVYNMGRGLEIT
jgi:hypothetical protein